MADIVERLQSIVWHDGIAPTEAMRTEAALRAEAAATIESLRAENARLREALIWCSGSADFAPEGQARAGFEKLVLPLIAPTPPEGADQ